MVRVSHDQHSSGAWSLKDRTDAVVSSGIRGRTVSTHILGIGIVLVGVVVLAVGLIMGLEFPEYVHKQIKEKQCVVYPGHEMYTSWSQGSQWNRKVSVYYWTLVNANNFLFKGHKPWFVQKGPYVYTETESKYDIKFAGTEVTYRLRRQFVFDQEATGLACSTCHEQDRLTILSPWYLQTVGQHGGEEALGWTYISKYTVTYLKTAGLLYREYDDIMFRQNASVFGIYTTAISSVSSQPLTNFSFGSWLHNSTSSYKSTIETKRGGQDFTLSEVKSLYRVLTNLTLLGGKALSQSNRTLQQICKLWAQRLCSPEPPRPKVILGMSECGVIYLLHNCESNISTEALDVLQETFCPSSSTSACLNLTNLPEDLLLAYENAISDFLWHLSTLVTERFLKSRDLSLVVSRNQSQLALGYNVSGDDVFHGVHVNGLLQSTWLGDASGGVPTWKVYTCLEKRNMDNNMKVKEYNNSWWFLGQNARSFQKVSVASFTDFVTSCPSLSTCQTCSSPGRTLNLFIEGLLRAASFLLNSSASVDGVDVFRYELDTSAFNNSSRLKLANGLQNMAETAGYLSWTSLPPVTGDQFSHVTIGKTQIQENSYVLIEPVTGRVWERNIKLQWNVGISNESAQVQGKHITASELPLPVIWTERTATLTSSEIAAYKHLVTRLMYVSCGGVIGFSVIAIIIMIAGIVVCMYPSKPNRISPMVEDSSNSIPNGRHL